MGNQEEKYQDPDEMAPEHGMSDEELLKKFKQCLKDQMEDERESREMMLDDIAFQSLDQWDHSLRKERENDPNGARPCLTIDKINQYISQVTNEMRKNKPSVKARPQDDASDPQTAKIIQGIIRHEEDQSNAPVAYETAGDSAVKCGLGYFRVITEYEAEDSFNQVIRVKRIPDVFSVYLGPHTMPDGSDADWGVIIEMVPEERFKKEYPGKKFSDDDFLEDIHIWKPEGSVLVAEYYYTEYTKDKLLFLGTGKTVFQSDFKGDNSEIVKDRTAIKKSIKWAKVTGCEVLEKRLSPCKWVPIVEVVGKESFVEGKRMLWGVVRPVKDNLRMYNYWASAVTEKIGLAPKMPFVGAVGQFATMGDKWDKANRVNYAKLEYDPIDVNGNAVPAPQRVQPAPMEIAMVNMMQMIDRDVQTSLGIYKAGLGESESQQSGKAILALQGESDTGTYHFQDNLNRSIRHCGRIILDLIPKIMDTKRIARIIGEDDEFDAVTIDPKQPTAYREIKDMMTGKIKKIYNPGIGIYDITVTVGPSYATKRMEAADAMLKIVQANPQELQLIGDLMFKAFDWPMADEIAKRHKAMLPPQLQDQEEGPIPPKAMEKMQMMSEEGKRLQLQVQEMGQELAQAKSGVAEKQKELAIKEKIAVAEYDLEKKKVGRQLEIEEEKTRRQLDMQKRKMDFEHSCKIDVLQKEAEISGFPQVVSSLEMSLERMATAMQQQLEMQSQTLQTQQLILESITRPSSVSIGSIQKDEDGRIIGATINKN